MAERRYARFQRADVWATLYQQQEALDVHVYDDTAVGNCVQVERFSSHTPYKAVVLARSSDWYTYSLNCTDRWKHEIEAVICGTHDSCIDKPVLAVDTRQWYEPKQMRIESLKPLKVDQQGRAIDAFNEFRKYRYGHSMLIGALMCGREDGMERLQRLPPSTRFRIEATLRQLHQRRTGRPLRV